MTIDELQEMVEFSFDSFSRQNGDTYWLASELMRLLGYQSMQSFKKVINRAMIVLNNLDIDIAGNIDQMVTDDSGTDFKLSRFACYLCAMNADVRKKEVSQIQAYFVAFTQAFTEWVEHEKAIERVFIRGEISEHERSISGLAKEHGIQTYAFFQNSGYRGLYNMSINKLRTIKGIPDKRSPLDFMDTTELAANLFRITQTEERIKNKNISGQEALEIAAESVGKDVRSLMIKNGGTAPEDIPAAQDIRKVKTSIRQTHRKMLKNKK
jgi:DNA-damage-inducible protein D